ncbi:hypothetical protein PG997_005994 [Apiospora hydei]|uniref:Uncharacterized protein n=1 Tax=Apiospora hydei TaxID=1337664 RepID=A0ABR1WRH5_9PEZI
MPSLDFAIPDKLKKECNVALNKHSRADELLGQGKMEEAENLLREAVEWSNQSLGAAHKMTVSYQEDLAILLAQVNKFDEAIKVNFAAWQARKEARDTSPSRHTAQLNLARDLTHKGKMEEAASHFERVYASQLSDAASFGKNHACTLRTGYELATCWFSLGDRKKDNHLRAKAKELHEDVLQRQLRGKGSRTVRYCSDPCSLGR